MERLLTHLSDEAEAWAVSGERRAGECIVRKEPSRVARQAARLSGPPGVSLADELERLGLSDISARSDERPAA